VSKAEAQTIVHEPITGPREAPLGPTCIYQPARGGNSVTLTVESVDFAAIEGQLRDRRRVTIGGHTAYCGYLGQPTMFVPLSSGRVLHLTASCMVGSLFAARALTRLNI
jgi:hypothetical protein